MMGCNASGEWPTKFNGGMFTFDPAFVESMEPFTPDYRKWAGGIFTAQNQRLLYWPLLRSGDIETMKQQFDFYKRTTKAALLRGQLYFGINATIFTEQIENYWLPNICEYDRSVFDDGKQRPVGFPVGDQWNNWQTWLVDTANEFADMILQANIYEGFDVSPYLEFIEYQLAFLDLYYLQEHDAVDSFPLTGKYGNSTLIIYPGSGAETYKGAYNPSSTVSGLRKVIVDLLSVNTT